MIFTEKSMIIEFEKSLVFKDRYKPGSARDVEDFNEDYQNIEDKLKLIGLKYEYSFGVFTILPQKMLLGLGAAEQLIRSLNELFKNFEVL